MCLLHSILTNAPTAEVSRQDADGYSRGLLGGNGAAFGDVLTYERAAPPTTIPAMYSRLTQTTKPALCKAYEYTQFTRRTTLERHTRPGRWAVLSHADTSAASWGLFRLMPGKEKLTLASRSVLHRFICSCEGRQRIVVQRLVLNIQPTASTQRPGIALFVLPCEPQLPRGKAGVIRVGSRAAICCCFHLDKACEKQQSR